MTQGPGRPPFRAPVPARAPLPGPLPGPDASASAVRTTLFRALAVLRVVVVTYTVILNASRWREFDHPVAGWSVVGLIVLWTVLAGWAYDAPRRRRWPLLVVDLGVAAAALLSTPHIESTAMLERNASTIPSFWVLVAVLGWAVAWGWVAGVGAAVLISVLDLSVRAQATGTTWGNIFLLVVAAGVVGYSCQLMGVATEARAAAEREAAVLAERARLARAVHDGVLQVLALVQRRGDEIGGEAVELGRLAAEQQVALRALVQGDAAMTLAPHGTADLVDALRVLASAQVTVALPPGDLVLPERVVREVCAVVVACLDNVARHVGERAPAWVLLEQVHDEVVVTVRDEGPGIAEGRLAEAAREGRLGVSESVRGRMSALGGRADLVTGAGLGTAWELRLPLRERRPVGS